ncbi:MAG: twin-arginine translocation signal domain-containing protein, partial [Fimbriimonadales bacterium]|nr:twin-arginine translocation signal domain-containing protein [Fimbriimonadales bacterium]
MQEREEQREQGAPLCEHAAGEFWAAEMSRRQFLKAGLTLVAVGLAAPPWLAQIAHADAQRLRKGEKLPNDHILVVLQLTGGNDGLNTVIPYRDELYYQSRPTLAIPEAQAVPLDERLGLHPALAPLKPLYEQRALAILQNVGYPNPNRSHFRSMEIWQTADPDGHSRYGWLGKYLDTLTDAAANPVMAISFTQELPIALHGKKAQVPCFASLTDLQVMTRDPELERTLKSLSQAEERKMDSPATVVRQSTRTALEAMEQLRERIRNYQPNAQYANDPFARGLQQAAQIIATSP